MSVIHPGFILVGALLGFVCGDLRFLEVYSGFDYDAARARNAVACTAMGALGGMVLSAGYYLSQHPLWLSQQFLWLGQLLG